MLTCSNLTITGFLLVDFQVQLHYDSATKISSAEASTGPILQMLGLTENKTYYSLEKTDHSLLCLQT